MITEKELDEIIASVWSGQFKNSIEDNNTLNLTDNQITWINDAIKQRLNKQKF